MSMLTWWWLPLIPLMFWLALLRWSSVQRWIWLAPLPALILLWQPPASIELPMLWPGASLGIESQLNHYFLLLTTLLWSAASVYAAVTEREHPRLMRFWSFWLWSMTGNLLLVIALDPASFYVGFTLMSLAAYGLVAHQSGPLPRQAGRLYLQLAVLGEMLIYVGLMLRVHETGGLLSFTDRQQPIGWLTALCLLTGFGLKAGFWPLHIWLPLAHPVAPAAASAVLSGAMLKAGILGIWQFIPAQTAVSMSLAPTLFYLGLFGAFYAVAAGLLQNKAKTVLAFSSVSQMAYMLMIIALFWLDTESSSALLILLALYGLHHGVAKAALFMGAGQASSRRLNNWHWLLILLPALALAGMPLTTGAAVKYLLKEAVSDSMFAMALPLLSLGSLATALLLLRAFYLMKQSQTNVTNQSPPETSLLLSWGLLAIAPVLMVVLIADFRSTAIQLLQFGNLLGLLWPLCLALVAGFVVSKLAITWPRAGGLIPGRWFSLKIRYWLLHFPMPKFHISVKQHGWRNIERNLNKIMAKGTLTVSISLTFLIVLSWTMLLG